MNERSPYQQFTDILNSSEFAGQYEIREDVPLKTLTSFRVGGPAKSVIAPFCCEAFVFAVNLARSSKLKYYLLGNGTNVLASDDGYDGIIFLTTSMKRTAFDGTTVTSECGASLTALSAAAGNGGLTGLEFAYGIPGTVGGGVFMNAGAYGGELKDVVTSVTALFPDGRVRTLGADECDFGYRHSAFSENGAVVLSCTIELKVGNKDEIHSLMENLLGRRKSKQPLEYPSAGSTFKRYPGRYTGQMIEQHGLKGFSVGGAQVSDKHAGFVINTGNATSQDIHALIDHIKAVIRQKEGIEIEPEVRFLD